MQIHKWLEARYVNGLSLGDRLKYLNRKLKLLGKSVVYSEHAVAPLITVRDGREELVFCRPERAGLYRRGIDRRVSRLEKSYLLPEIADKLNGGVFIDCGANIGELGRFCRRNNLEYHAFEPEELEGNCCDQNNYGGEPRTNRLALWNEETVLKLYSKPTTADSSVIEMKGFTTVKEIPTTTLDAYVAKHGITKIAVMKIEAEGAEPEILEGAKAALAITDYVTVDCGFERGQEQTSTLAPVANFLIRNGFEMQNWNSEWHRFLFRRANSIAIA